GREDLAALLQCQAFRTHGMTLSQCPNNSTTTSQTRPGLTVGAHIPGIEPGTTQERATSCAAGTVRSADRPADPRARDVRHRARPVHRGESHGEAVGHTAPTEEIRFPSTKYMHLAPGNGGKNGFFLMRPGPGVRRLGISHPRSRSVTVRRPRAPPAS